MKFDAVIVLAHQMDKYGVLNEESKSRAHKAVELFYKYSISYLVTCGWDYREDSKIKIANSFKLHLMTEYGINKDEIVPELNSRDTVGDAFFTKKNIALPMGWKKLCVVTSNYHVPRTQEIFEFIYGKKYDIKVYGASVNACKTVINREALSTKAFYDTFMGVEPGDDKLILNALRFKHPYYNGESFQKI